VCDEDDDDEKGEKKEEEEEEVEENDRYRTYCKEPAQRDDRVR